MLELKKENLGDNSKKKLSELIEKFKIQEDKQEAVEKILINSIPDPLKVWGVLLNDKAIGKHFKNLIAQLDTPSTRNSYTEKIFNKIKERIESEVDIKITIEIKEPSDGLKETESDAKAHDISTDFCKEMVKLDASGNEMDDKALVESPQTLIEVEETGKDSQGYVNIQSTDL